MDFKSQTISKAMPPICPIASTGNVFFTGLVDGTPVTLGWYTPLCFVDML